jgi:hypothetical protein
MINGKESPPKPHSPSFMLRRKIAAMQIVGQC